LTAAAVIFTIAVPLALFEIVYVTCVGRTERQTPVVAMH
jgi:hypothetical protein